MLAATASATMFGRVVRLEKLFPDFASLKEDDLDETRAPRIERLSIFISLKKGTALFSKITFRMARDTDSNIFACQQHNDKF
jgi:hypothetical protein